MKLAPVALVFTTTLYLVRVLMPAAVTCAQQRLTMGKVAVPVPIVNTTGAPMIAVDGIV